jgi:hypothetical protein
MISQKGVTRMNTNYNIQLTYNDLHRLSCIIESIGTDIRDHFGDREQGDTVNIVTEPQISGADMKMLDKINTQISKKLDQ